MANTLGLSDELFGMKMKETSAVNHLKSADGLELFTILFSSVSNDELPSFLINKCGFYERDIGHVISLVNAINSIDMEYPKGVEFESRKFLSNIGKKRIQNAVRLLNQLDLKELSKTVRKQKVSSFSVEEVAIDISIIKAAFGIENKDMLDKLINIAIQKVLENPEFNTRTKLLTYLNNERKYI
jgi:hypothetical protein